MQTTRAFADAHKKAKSLTAFITRRAAKPLIALWSHLKFGFDDEKLSVGWQALMLMCFPCVNIKSNKLTFAVNDFASIIIFYANIWNTFTA